MRTIKSLLVIVPLILLISCQSPYNKKDKEPIKIGIAEKKTDAKEEKEEPKEDIVDLDNKGIGPVKDVEIGEEIDQSMADAGKEVFNSTCIACHKPAQRFVGPAPKDILDRRSPEWVMNMIVNPTEMLDKDPIAKQLLEEYGAPMPDLGTTEEEARELVEYFRTL